MARYIEEDELVSLLRTVPDEAELFGYQKCLNEMKALEKKYPGSVQVIEMGKSPNGNLIYRVEIGERDEPRPPFQSLPLSKKVKNPKDMIGFLVDPHSGVEPYAYTAAYYWALWRLRPENRDLLKKQKLVMYYVDPDRMIQNERTLSEQSLYKVLLNQRREPDPFKQPDWSFRSRHNKRPSKVAKMIMASVKDELRKGHRLKVWVSGHNQTVAPAIYFGVSAKSSQLAIRIGFNLECLPKLIRKFVSPASMLHLGEGGLDDTPGNQYRDLVSTYQMGTANAWTDHDDTSKVGSTSFEAMRELVPSLAGVMVEVNAFQPTMEFSVSKRNRDLLSEAKIRAIGRSIAIKPFIDRGIALAEALPSDGPLVQDVLALKKIKAWGEGSTPQTDRPIWRGHFLQIADLWPANRLRFLGAIQEMIEKNRPQSLAVDPELSGQLNWLIETLYVNTNIQTCKRLPNADVMRLQLSSYELTAQKVLLNRELSPSLTEENIALPDAKQVEALKHFFGTRGRDSGDTAMGLLN